ncbi:hypothetical protein ACSZNL_13235 [Aeromonas jandaei]
MASDNNPSDEDDKNGKAREQEGSPDAIPLGEEDENNVVLKSPFTATRDALDILRENIFGEANIFDTTYFNKKSNTKTFNYNNSENTKSELKYLTDEQLQLLRKDVFDHFDKKINKLVGDLQPSAMFRLDALVKASEKELQGQLNSLMESEKSKLQEDLNSLMESEKSNIDGKIDEKFAAFNKSMEDAKSSILGSIAIFSGIISYISVSVTLFDKIQSPLDMIALLLAIMLCLICFLAFIVSFLKNKLGFGLFFGISMASLSAIAVVFFSRYGFFLFS